MTFKGRLPILYYHSISGPEGASSPDPIWVPPALFRRQMEILKERGFRAVSVREMLGDGESDIGSEKLVGLSFDDGFEDNYREAFPILKDLGFRCTVFLVTGRIRNTSTPPVGLRIRDGRLRYFLEEEQIREMAGCGIEFGSHSVTHRNLLTLDERELEEELRISREEIAALTGQPVPGFSYPFGMYSARVRDAVLRAGYSYACTTINGWPWTLRDRFALRRIESLASDSPESFSRKLTAASSWSSYLLRGTIQHLSALLAGV
jgi:peptidoglycan/xylan/chitin deacetylase (PgdA/CDA1 family)